MTDDSALYTGVDNEGVFGNEAKDEKTEQFMAEQRKQLAEITPKLQLILDMIESERELALGYIADYTDNTKDDSDIYRAEVKATARYRKYLEELKTKFTLALREAKRNDRK